MSGVILSHLSAHQMRPGSNSQHYHSEIFARRQDSSLLFTGPARAPAIRRHGRIVTAYNASGPAFAGRTTTGIDTVTMTWLSSNPPSVWSLVGRSEYAVQSRSVTNWKGWSKALVFRRALTARTKLFRCRILR